LALLPPNAASEWRPSLPARSASVAFSCVRSVILTEERYLHFQLNRNKMIDITQENGRQTRNLRMALLILNYGHNNEIYGNLVTYLRIKSIVPASSEPRPQQQPPRQQ
jgi:hypothetical protein